MTSTANTTQPVIRVEDLSRSFRFHEKAEGKLAVLQNLFARRWQIRSAVKAISFEAHAGEVVGFIGPNGAGKTTTLKILSGILHPSSGNVSVLGFTPWKRERGFQKQIATVLGQKSNLWWDLPARESLRLARAIYSIPKDQFLKTKNELLARLNIAHLQNVQVRSLSLGERMKFELVSSLLHRPKVLFLDEPTIGLDLVSQREIRNFIREHCHKWRTCVMLTSHYLADVQALADKLVVMHQGSIVYDGPLDSASARLTQKKRLELLFEHGVLSDVKQAFPDCSFVDKGRAMLDVDTELVSEVLETLAMKFPAVQYSVRDLPLGDSLLGLYESK